MDNKALEDIKNYAVQRLNREYGYCGVAEGASMAMINSGNDKRITINIKIEKGRRLTSDRRNGFRHNST